MVSIIVGAVACAADFNVCEFGAKVEALPKENAVAIQKAIDAAAVKGGRVVVPAGTFVSGTLWLKSGVTLRLEKGAVLKASPNFEDYNAEDAYPENYGCPQSEYWRGLHFLITRCAQHVRIEGEGVIDGNGEAFFDPQPIRYFSWMKPGADCWSNGIRWAKDKKNLRPGQLVVFVKCRDVEVEGITIRNSPCWCLFFHACENVAVRNYTVRCGRDDGNTDGVDVDCSKNVVLENLDIDTGDDAVAIRASGWRLKMDAPPPCENVVVRNARLRSNSSVFRIGVGEGEIRNVRVENVRSDFGGTAITMRTLYGDANKYGVDMENIVFRDCQFTNCRGAYHVVTGGKALTYGIRDVTFEKCTFPADASRTISSMAGCPFKPERVRVLP